MDSIKTITGIVCIVLCVGVLAWGAYALSRINQEYNEELAARAQEEYEYEIENVRVEHREPGNFLLLDSTSGHDYLMVQAEDHVFEVRTDRAIIKDSDNNIVLIDGNNSVKEIRLTKETQDKLGFVS